jgi:hypothetical protein
MAARCLRLKHTNTELVVCMTVDAMEPLPGAAPVCKVGLRRAAKLSQTASNSNAACTSAPNISRLQPPPIAGFSHLHEPGKAATTMPAGVWSSSRQAKERKSLSDGRPKGLARRQTGGHPSSGRRDFEPDFAPNAKGGCRNRLRLLYYRLYNISFK